MRPCLLRGLKETLAESSFRHGASRMLQGLTFTSEEWRVGNLGPALFAVIALSVAVILLCCLSQYFDKPEIRTKLRVLAFLLFIVPLLYFTTVTYAKTESEVAKNRKFDSSFLPRFGIQILLIISLAAALASFFVGSKPSMTMHMQGRAVYTTKER
mmetsp:Transcript_4007/g.5043  ORF Transcript_4007/g.5043 Transcript_4007/m.5043 type:complete len:156 (+) Transcript_4007:193-660(+)